MRGVNGSERQWRISMGGCRPVPGPLAPVQRCGVVERQSEAEAEAEQRWDNTGRGLSARRCSPGAPGQRTRTAHCFALSLRLVLLHVTAS